MAMHGSTHRVSANEIKHRSWWGIFHFILFSWRAHWSSALKRIVTAQSKITLHSLRPQVLVFSSHCKLIELRIYTLRRGPLVGKNNADFSYTPSMKKLFSFKLSHHITLELESGFLPLQWKSVSPDGEELFRVPFLTCTEDGENATSLWSSLRAWWKDFICTSLWRRALMEHKVDPAKIFQEYLPGRNVPPGHACKVLFVKGSRCSYFSMMTCLPWGLGAGEEMPLAPKSPCQNGTLTLCLCCISQDVYPKDGKFCRVFLTTKHKLHVPSLVFLLQEARLCCTRPDVTQYKIMTSHTLCEICDADIRKFKELMRK